MDTPDSDLASFIERWKASGSNERANYVMFLTELCAQLDLKQPEPARDDGSTDYRFEYPVKLRDDDGKASTGRIDLYKKSCFVLEAKQGTDKKLQEDPPLFGLSGNGKSPSAAAKRGTDAYRLAMQRARRQAEGYAKALPTAHGWPPFLLVVDVGHSIECFADFSLTGKNYSQFPDARSFRIMLGDLNDPAVRSRLATIWTDPLSLDPAKVTAKVTKEIADDLAQLAKLMEKKGLRPESVAQFLMRCLFTMFAEDVRLLPEGCFLKLLDEIIAGDDPKRFKRQMEAFWGVMNKGGFEPWLGRELLRFNGGLFAEPEALDLDREEIGVLRKAARRDWKDVEPAIFGTLLERALDPRERHKLGAHFTPRAYVERLVMPTVIEPLREDWANVQGSAMLLAAQGKTEEALAEVKAFHQQLCNTRVLDPACGSGNFLYVTMEHMKRLEGEVIELAKDLGEDQYFLELDRHTVDPHQFLGIELNPRAAVIAELVLWIGYLQWHFKTRGSVMPAQPVLRNFKNIECRDAILEWDREEIVRGPDGKPLTRWDGHTMKTHPVTGRAVPDDTAREPVMRYIGPRAAKWPHAEFIVGNPPYIGSKLLKAALGDGYVQALRNAYSKVPGSADLVMYWWIKSAQAVQSKLTRRSGLIATKALGQHYNRRATIPYLDDKKRPLSFRFAIPNHPWVDSKDGAAVRVSMTVIESGDESGRLDIIKAEKKMQDGLRELQFLTNVGKIGADLRIRDGLLETYSLLANVKISWQGVKLVGDGFKIDRRERDFLVKIEPECATIVRRYWIGDDLKRGYQDRFVIDAYGLAEAAFRKCFPHCWQIIHDRVYPYRSENRDKGFKERWWLFGRPRPDLRYSLEGLRRYIATSETSKHRFFIFLDWPSELIDGSAIAIASDDAAVLGSGLNHSQNMYIVARATVSRKVRASLS